MKRPPSSRAISRLGERQLIQRIARSPATRPPRGAWKSPVPLGDDAYVATVASSCSIALTTDALIEDTHFRLAWMRRYLSEAEVWRAIGYKAMAVNLSDLASMGDCQPRLGLVTFGCRGDISVDIVDNFYRGFAELTRYFRFFVAGGDLIRSDKTMLSLTLVGEMRGANFLTRDRAKNGDILMSTGPLGLSAAGLAALQAPRKVPKAVAAPLLKAHLRPVPQLVAGKVLAAQATLATSCMDLSDDLRSSLAILGERSGVGAEVDLDRVPVPAALARFCRLIRQSPRPFQADGGEDYQLLFTVPPDRLQRIRQRLPQAVALGRIIPKKRGIRILAGGRELEPSAVRFDHFE